MSQITSLYVHKVLSHTSPGVKTGDLLERLGIIPGAAIDPRKMVPSLAFYDFFAALAGRDPQGLTLPLRIGASMRCDEYGAFGLAFKTAPSLRGSYLRSQRYGGVLGSAETYTLERSGDGCYFSLDKAGDGRPGMLISNEASLSAVDVISREVSSVDFQPIAVFFRHAARGDVSVYEAHFRCPVHFESGRDALLLGDEMLDAPNRLGDETVANFFDRHLEQELESLASDDDLEQRLRRALTSMLSEGVPTLSSMASKLGIGSRTLQRRLQEGGHSFQVVVDTARRDLACRLLRETNYSLGEIAFLTGFSDQSAFNRAFKRWSGDTPRSYRLTSARPEKGR
jgi:AraC-like DNA-binding protein